MNTITNVTMTLSVAGSTMLAENQKGEQEFIQLNDKQQQQFAKLMKGKFSRKQCPVCELVQ